VIRVRKLPLAFEANQGQADAQVKFLSRGSNCTLFLTSTEAVLAFPALANLKPGKIRFSIWPDRLDWRRKLE
jgi:hypothetical protein